MFFICLFWLLNGYVVGCEVKFCLRMYVVSFCIKYKLNVDFIYFDLYFLDKDVVRILKCWVINIVEIFVVFFKCFVKFIISWVVIWKCKLWICFKLFSDFYLDMLEKLGIS